MKKISIILSVLFILSLSFTGCGAAEKAEKKAAEKITEKAIENAIGGDADVKIDGEKYTVDYGDGAKMEIGNAQWPTEGPALEIPKLNKGVVISVITVENVCNISIEKIKKEDFDSYLQTVKDDGFTENVVNMSEGDSGIMYMAETKEGQSISLTYTTDSETLNIMTALPESEE